MCWRLTAVLILALAGPGALGAQVGVTVLRDGSRGSELVIEFDHVLTGPSVTEATPTTGSRMSTTPSGGFVVAPLIESYAWAEFDHAGAFQSLVGREGEGPGEFGSIDFTVPLTDSLRLVFHDSRATAVTSDGEYLRSRLFLGLPLGASPGLGQSVFVPKLRFRGGREFLSLSKFDGAGNLESDIPLHLQDLSGLSTVAGRVAYDGMGTFYLANVYEDRIAAFDTIGGVIGEFRREPPWALGPDEGPEGPRLPRTITQALHYQSGFLWVLSSVRADDQPWGGFDSVVTFDERNNFVLEIIDIEGKELISVERFDSAPFHGTLGTNVFRMVENPVTGEISFEVLAPKLTAG